MYRLFPPPPPVRCQVEKILRSHLAAMMETVENAQKTYVWSARRQAGVGPECLLICVWSALSL
jgi:hypothetical protein